MDQARAPLFEQMLAYRNRSFSRFHVPGHKGGDWLEKEERDVFREVMRMDWTEVDGLDDLHDPRGKIAEAEQLAASCFGADRTFFLVGGSTAGNLAAVMSLCRPGDILIVQRNVHKSVLNGIALAGARAVFVPPVVDAETGLAGGVRPEDIRLALERYPGAAGVFLSCPNYYGMGYNLDDVVRLAHAFEQPVAVDEAHGAHYGFHDEIPPSALSAGADIVVQSTHKMLTSLTMSGMLHLQGKRVSGNRLQSKLSLIQSSSPSYPLMASLDLARRMMALCGKERIERGLEAVRRFRRDMRHLPWFELSPERPGCRPGYATQDPFKIFIRDLTGTLGGFALQDELSRSGCLTEMADPDYVLAVFSLVTTEDDARQLYEGFRHLSDRYGLKGKKMLSGRRHLPANPFGSVTVSEPVPIFSEPDMPREPVPLDQAAGRIAAEAVIPYPPGIPVLYPGEKISREHVAQIEAWKEAGARFHGCADAALENLTVYPGSEQT